jgi:hypothetical protein
MPPVRTPSLRSYLQVRDTPRRAAPMKPAPRTAMTVGASDVHKPL